MKRPKITLLHHWLVSMRGGEKVLEQLCLLFPNASIKTIISRKDELSETIRRHPIHQSFLKHIPKAEEKYKSYLPFYPLLLGNENIEADFIISSDASMIKGIKKNKNIPHVCYCHSPPRYLWDMQDDYVNGLGSFRGNMLKMVTPYLRKFDQEAANSVDHFIANSAYVQQRILRIYNRDATVIHPPVDIEAFDYTKPSKDFYLIVSAMVPYKRIDLAVRAFNKLGKKLVVIGKGSELDYLKSISDTNIHFLGAQPFSVLKEHFETCKAFVFPGVEDFGITPLEAQASGKPVLAIREGGALETVIEGETGLFFDDKTPESLIDTIEKFEKFNGKFDAFECRKNAEHFSPERFRNEIKTFLTVRYPSFFSDFNWEIVKN